MLLSHAFAVVWQISTLPRAPVFGDEIIINDPAIALSRGQGLVAPSFADSVRGIDRMYAHFPPLYIYLQSIVFRVLGVSAVSLRLLTVSMSIAAIAVFLLLMHMLVRRGFASRTTGFLLSCVYAFHAPSLAMHRMSRMESLIEFLSLASLYCVMAACVGRDDEAGESRSKDLVWVGAGAFLAGLALAAHPEAIVAILPAMMLIVIAARLPIGVRLMVPAISVAVPVALWWLVYGSNSGTAFHQMTVIAAQDAPGPTVLRFGLDLMRKARQSSHDAMSALLFGVSLAVLLLVVTRSIVTLRNRHRGSGPRQRVVRLVQLSYGAAALGALALLIWFVPSSITRYEVLFPLYLASFAIPTLSLRNVLVTRAARVAVAGLLAVDCLAVSAYLMRGAQNRYESSAVYAAVLDCVPRDAKLAASPQLWLALEERNRPFTLLYPQFDGFKTWSAQSSNPLDRFDVILLDDELKQQLQQYQPYSSHGRFIKEYSTRFSKIDEYSKRPIPENCSSQW